MYIVTNEDHEIIDTATRFENLSPLHVLHDTNRYKVTDDATWIIGDFYDGQIYTPNEHRRNEIKREQFECQMIKLESERTACERLMLHNQQEQRQTEINKLKAKLV